MDQIPHIKLSELSAQIKNVLKDSFENKYFWVVAEVSGHKFYPENDRHYMDLVEKIEGKNTEAAKIKCTVWNEGSKKIKEFEKITGKNFEDGIEVLLKVRVEFHIVYGLSLVASDINASFTLGKLEELRLLTLSRLLKDNPDKVKLENGQYVTFNQGLQLKNVLQKIALVASPNSEGFHDFINNLTKNKFGYTFQVDYYFSSVQGIAAEEELKNKMVAIHSAGEKNYDCVVIIRGGGAKTDFLAFDTYGIARAVARFPVPVITGIGHLRDVSITDMMAHTSTNVPTKAAEFIVAHNRSFEEQLMRMQKSIIIRSQQSISSSQTKIFSFNNSIINKTRTVLAKRKDALVHINQVVINKTKSILFAQQKSLATVSNAVTSKPFISVRNKQNDLKNIASNLQTFSGMYLNNQRGYLQHYVSVVKIMSPKNILKKGFAIVKREGKILKNGDSIEQGNELNIILAETEIRTKVISKNKIDEHENEL